MMKKFSCLLLLHGVCNFLFAQVPVNSIGLKTNLANMAFGFPSVKLEYAITQDNTIQVNFYKGKTKEKGLFVILPNASWHSWHSCFTHYSKPKNAYFDEQLFASIGMQYSFIDYEDCFPQYGAPKKGKGVLYGPRLDFGVRYTINKQLSFQQGIGFFFPIGVNLSEDGFMPEGKPPRMPLKIEIGFGYLFNYTEPSYRRIKHRLL
jgi:hypothetical protein